MNNIYFVAGASGSGKSAVLKGLQQLLGEEVSVFDFDDIGVPDNADKKWRQQATEQWIARLVKKNKPAVLLGQMVLGEILASPSANKLGKVTMLLLDVSDIERVKRLQKRNTYGVNQDTLNWASWLRVHHCNPQWEQHVIKDGSWEGMKFGRWDDLSSWCSLAKVFVIDTTDLSISEVAQEIQEIVERKDIGKKI